MNLPRCRDRSATSVRRETGFPTCFGGEPVLAGRTDVSGFRIGICAINGFSESGATAVGASLGNDLWPRVHWCDDNQNATSITATAAVQPHTRICPLHLNSGRLALTFFSKVISTR